jgi:hypothetical protein
MKITSTKPRLVPLNKATSKTRTAFNSGGIV